VRTDEAILAFSQSEKIKAGLIWSTTGLELLEGLPLDEKKGAQRIINSLMGLISREINLAKVVAGQGEWDSLKPYIVRAIAMLESGVPGEAIPQLSRALSKVTNIGQQTMSLLKEKELL